MVESVKAALITTICGNVLFLRLESSFVMSAVLIGHVVGTAIPEVIDSSTNVDIKMLKQIALGANNPDLLEVGVVPDTSEDLAAYNVLLCNLHARNLAIMVNLDDRITLYMMPSSDFPWRRVKSCGPWSFVWGVDEVSTMHVCSMTTQPFSQQRVVCNDHFSLPTNPRQTTSSVAFQSKFTDDVALREKVRIAIQRLADSLFFSGGSGLLFHPGNAQPVGSAATNFVMESKDP